MGTYSVKLFPEATTSGPDSVKEVVALHPWLRLVPSGGLMPEDENLRGWFGTKVAAVCTESKLISIEWLQSGTFTPSLTV